MADKPNVSVIIPAYNRATTLGAAIRSVLGQTYGDLEVLVVDDGSTDDTEKVVRDIRVLDRRVSYIRHQRNEGAAAARNTGIRAAHGNYIAFQDSDDEWFPEKLERQVRVLDGAPPEVGVVYTGFWRIEAGRKIYVPASWVKQKEGDIHRELLKGNFIGTPTTVFRRECFERSGMFREDLPRLQDWDLLIRVSSTYRFRCVDEPLLISYGVAGGISTDRKALARAAEIILAEHHEDFSTDRKSLSRHYLGFGILLASTGEMKKGRSYIGRAITTYPLNARALPILFVSLLGRNAFNRTRAIHARIKAAPKSRRETGKT